MQTGGQSFVPNLAGPNGSGSPGSATSVNLGSITIGFPSASIEIRPTQCFVYSEMLDDQSEVGQAEGRVGVSTGTDDSWTPFGSGTYARTYNFSNPTTLDPTMTYYIYFAACDEQKVTYVMPNPYNGGTAWDTDFDTGPWSLQFQVAMTTN
jgi:hypothetical protein